MSDEQTQDEPKLEPDDVTPPEEGAGQAESEEVFDAEPADAEPVAEAGPLAELERERDQYLDLARRTQAEFENYRKRMTAEVGAAEARGKADLASSLIGVLDNLERALEALELDPAAVLSGEIEVEGALEQGVVLTFRELSGELQRVGLESYSPAGEKFDPTWHEALQARPDEETESGIVLEVMQKGYRVGERVLRPARVVVAA